MDNGGSPELGPKQFQADTSGLKGSGAESSRPLPQGLGSKQGERRETTHLQRDDAKEPKAGVLHEVPAQHQDAAGCKGAEVRAAALHWLLPAGPRPGPNQPGYSRSLSSCLPAFHSFSKHTLWARYVFPSVLEGPRGK